MSNTTETSNSIFWWNNERLGSYNKSGSFYSITENPPISINSIIKFKNNYIYPSYRDFIRIVKNESDFIPLSHPFSALDKNNYDEKKFFFENLDSSKLEIVNGIANEEDNFIEWTYPHKDGNLFSLKAFFDNEKERFNLENINKKIHIPLTALYLKEFKENIKENYQPKIRISNYYTLQEKGAVWLPPPVTEDSITGDYIKDFREAFCNGEDVKTIESIGVLHLQKLYKKYAKLKHSL